MLALPRPSRAESDGRVRGRLAAGDAVVMPGGERVFVTGDASTMGVVRDPRVIGIDFEAIGKFAAQGKFLIDPIHTKAIYAWKDGQRLFITYWCDVCSIRTYTPGTCWCCQEETVLDLRERYDK